MWKAAPQPVGVRLSPPSFLRSEAFPKGRTQRNRPALTGRGAAGRGAAASELFRRILDTTGTFFEHRRR
ncbi:hypothetical protein, partial [Methylacidimicrobium tartarophylax]|uniref:hypothetical protein n=1 Tax=Methylacidimicrobium tartarophylax TaxID=1041768 RepID=UPI001C49C102